MADYTQEERMSRVSPQTAIITAALDNPDTVCPLLVHYKVEAGWFETEDLQCAFSCIIELFQRGDPVDPITVADMMTKTGFDNGPSIIEALMSNTSALASHAQSYIEIMREAFFVSGMLNTLHRIEAKLLRHETNSSLAANELAEVSMNLLDMKDGTVEKSPYEMRCEALSEWIELARKGAGTMGGHSWGIRGLDELTTGIYPGINVIAARPSVGKTLFEGHLRRWFLSIGLKVFCCSLDMDPKQTVQRDMCAIGGESLNRMRSGFMTASDAEKMSAVVKLTEDWKDREWVYGSFSTAEAIVAKARAIMIRRGLDIITVDYAQLLDTQDNRGYNDNTKISRAIGVLKAFSITNKIPVILLSQLSRATEKEDREPQLSDLRDSGSIEQDATTVTFLYADPKVADYWTKLQNKQSWKNLEIRPIIANLLKNQNGRTGVIGLRELAPYFTIEEAEPCNGAQPGDDADSINYGYDYSKTLCNKYIIARHPKGAYEMFNSLWFDKLNEAAEKLGQDKWVRLDQYDANGFEEGMYQLNRARSGGHANVHMAAPIVEAPALPPNPADDDMPF